jgi:hypothetical protein
VLSTAAGGSLLPSGSNTVPALSTSGYPSANNHSQGADASTTFGMASRTYQETRFTDPLQTMDSTRNMGCEGVVQSSGRKHGPVASVPPDPLQEVDPKNCEHAAQEPGREPLLPDSLGAVQESEREHVPSDSLQIVDSTNGLGADQGSEREHIPSNSLQIEGSTNSEGAAQESEQEFVPVAALQLGPLRETDSRNVALEGNGYVLLDPLGAMGKTRDFDPEGISVLPDPLQAMDSTRDFGGGGGIQGSEREHSLVVSDPIDSAGGLDDDGAKDLTGNSHVGSMLLNPWQAADTMRDFSGGGGIQGSEREHSLVVSDPIDSAGGLDDDGAKDLTGNSHAGSMLLNPWQAADTTRDFSGGGGIQGSEQEHSLVTSEPADPINSRGLDDEGAKDLTRNSHAGSLLLDPLQAMDTTGEFSGGGRIQGSEQEHSLVTTSEPADPINSRGLDDEGAKDLTKNSHADSMLLDPLQAADTTRDFSGGGGIQGSEQEHSLVTSEPADPINSRGLGDEGAMDLTRNSHAEGEGHADSMLLDPLPVADAMRDFDGEERAQGSKGEHSLGGSVHLDSLRTSIKFNDKVGVQGFKKKPHDSHPVALSSRKRSHYRVNENQGAPFPSHYYHSDGDPQSSDSGDDNTSDFADTSGDSSESDFRDYSSLDDSKDGRTVPKRRKNQVSQHKIIYSSITS